MYKNDDPHTYKRTALKDIHASVYVTQITLFIKPKPYSPYSAHAHSTYRLSASLQCQSRHSEIVKSASDQNNHVWDVGRRKSTEIWALKNLKPICQVCTEKFLLQSLFLYVYLRIHTYVEVRIDIYNRNFCVRFSYFLKMVFQIRRFPICK